MKYVMLETADGRRMPILFPDELVHADVANLMCRLASLTMLRTTKPISAGSVGLTTPPTVAGVSETLHLAHNPLDGMRMFMGGAVAHMPDEMLAMAVRKLYPNNPIDGV